MSHAPPHLQLRLPQGVTAGSQLWVVQLSSQSVYSHSTTGVSPTLAVPQWITVAMHGAIPHTTMRMIICGETAKVWLYAYLTLT